MNDATSTADQSAGEAAMDHSFARCILHQMRVACASSAWAWRRASSARWRSMHWPIWLPRVAIRVTRSGSGCRTAWLNTSMTPRTSPPSTMGKPQAACSPARAARGAQQARVLDDIGYADGRPAGPDTARQAALGPKRARPGGGLKRRGVDEHQAARPLRARAAQEVLGRRAGGDPQPHGLQEGLKGRAQRRLVIADVDQGLSLH